MYKLLWSNAPFPPTHPHSTERKKKIEKTAISLEVYKYIDKYLVGGCKEDRVRLFSGA